MPNWDHDIHKKNIPAPEPASTAIQECFARLFISPDGKMALQHLRKITFERPLPTASDDRALREHNGKGQLVQHIENLRDAGIKAMTTKNKKAKK